MQQESIFEKIVWGMLFSMTLVGMFGFFAGFFIFYAAGQYSISMLCFASALITLVVFTRPKIVHSFTDTSVLFKSIFSSCVVEKKDVQWVFFPNELPFDLPRCGIWIKTKDSFFPLNIHTVSFYGNEDFYYSNFFTGWRNKT
ncbi:MAG: hypothetical protein AB7D51_08510 [Desulfovibrionaceae bacterium]